SATTALRPSSALFSRTGRSTGSRTEAGSTSTHHTGERVMAAATLTSEAGRARRKAEVAIEAIGKAREEGTGAVRLFWFEERARAAVEQLPAPERPPFLARLQAQW